MIIKNYCLLLLLFLFNSNLYAEENIMILKLKDGDVKIKLFEDIAPKHVERFKKLSDDKKYDGVVLEAFDSNYWAYHLGKNGSSHMHSHSVGIEVCNFGPLTKDGDKYYTWANTEVHPDNVCDLGTMWRGYQYWHNYSDEQIASLERLIKHIANEHNINLNLGLKESLLNEEPFRAFGFKDDAFYGKIKGVLSHSNTRKDKTDMYPHPLLVEMLKNLEND